jgi:hypothetical protein
MVSYIKSREIMTKAIEEKIIPLLREKDLDYEQVISQLALKSYLSPKSVKNYFESLITGGRVKLIKTIVNNEIVQVLTIPDKEVDKWLEEHLKTEKEKEEDKKKSELFLEELEKEKENASDKNNIS